MVLNTETLVHIFTINRAHISISADKRIKKDEISNAVVVMFPNIVLWMIVWCFGRDSDTFRGIKSVQECYHAAVIKLSSTKLTQKVTVHHL